MEDTLHKLMTPELAIYWGLGSVPCRSAVSSGGNSRVAVTVFTIFMNHTFSGDPGNTHLPFQDRLGYVESWSGKLKTFFEHFS
jgi:hypothetical protein